MLCCFSGAAYGRTPAAAVRCPKTKARGCRTRSDNGLLLNRPNRSASIRKRPKKTAPVRGRTGAAISSDVMGALHPVALHQVLQAKLVPGSLCWLSEGTSDRNGMKLILRPQGAQSLLSGLRSWHRAQERFRSFPPGPPQSSLFIWGVSYKTAFKSEL